jgi:hypothetical protein
MKHRSSFYFWIVYAIVVLVYLLQPLIYEEVRFRAWAATQGGVAINTMEPITPVSGTPIH